ncbi:MAG: hypothetical protein AAF411_10905 [Myxococcota bacterium]
MTADASTTARRRPWLGIANTLTGATLLGIVWGALPARWAPVDVGGTLLALAFIGAGALLFNGAESGRRVARTLAVVCLGVGMLLGTTLVITAASLAGLYGPVGAGGSLILAAAFFLMVPYLVVFPAVQVHLLRQP